MSVLAAPRVGQRYRVTFQDCCVSGSFEATVSRVEADDEFVYELAFDNGVVLTNTAAAKLEET